MRFLGSAFEFSDPLINQSEQVCDAIGHRRVCGQRGFFRPAADKPGVGAALEHPLGFGNQVPERINFLGNRRPAAEQHFCKFLKPEQPERQIQRVGVDDHRFGRKRCGKLVVRIKDQNPQRRVGFQRLVQKQRNRRGLADAGGADDGKMP